MTKKTRSARLTLKAPLKTGDHVVVGPQSGCREERRFIRGSVDGDLIHRQASHDARSCLGYSAHRGRRRQDFKIKIGIKCSSECAFANKAFAIYDHDGAEIATGVLSGDIWPGTSGLYFAEVELKAPSSAGLYQWSVKCAGKDLERPHAEGAADFSLRVVPRPECLVTVEAVDKASQEPLAGARVALHPYKAVTDERGFAEIRVAKGAYDLFVAKTRYLTLGLPVEVTADMTARAELDLEPEIERN